MDDESDESTDEDDVTSMGRGGRGVGQRDRLDAVDAEKQRGQGERNDQLFATRREWTSKFDPRQSCRKHSTMIMLKSSFRFRPRF